MHYHIKKSLQLQAQYHAVKHQVALKNIHLPLGLKEYSTYYPAASIEAGELGSWYDEGIILHSGQSWYEEEVFTLQGLASIELALRYESLTEQRGIFGTGWKCNYEQRFAYVKKGLYRLSLSDGRRFAFVREKEGGFRDEGGLGVHVKTRGDDRYELHYHDGHKEYYSQGYLVGTEDRDGNRVYLTYNAQSMLISVHNDYGKKILFEYGSNALVSSVRDHSGRVWHFAYKHGMLLKVKQADSPLAMYHYEPHTHTSVPLLVKVSSAKYTKMAFTYDTLGRVDLVAQENSRYRYSYTKDAAVCKHGGNGALTSYAIDRGGLVSGIRYPDGSATSIRYDHKRYTATIQTRGGNERAEIYDEKGRLLELRTNDTSEVTYRYESDNPSPVEYQQAGLTHTYLYDARHRLIEAIDPEGTFTEYDYNEKGQLLSITNMRQESTRYSYNKQGDLSAITDAQGNTSTYRYDALSRLIEIQEPNGATHHYDYTPQDQIALYRNPKEESIAFTYTPAGMVEEIKDGAHRQTTFVYDDYSRLAQKSYPDGSMESYGYTEEGRLSTIKRVDGSILTLHYDLNNNITKLIATDTEGNEEQLSYSYDALSNLLEAHTPEHTLKLQYNDKANLTAEIQKDLRVDKHYTPCQNRIASIHAAGESIAYEYDEYKILRAISMHQQPILLRQDDTKARTARIYPNGTKEKIAYTPTAQIASINALHYSYDTTGRVTQKEDNTTGTDTSYSYAIDGALQKEERPDQSRHYGYDKAGNRTESAQHYDSMNRLVEDATHLYSYDARGNLKLKHHKQTQEQTHYVFSLFNQLSRWKRIDRDNHLIEGYTYSYDALNRRVSKTHVTPGNNPKHPEQTTYHYLYDDENIIGILDANKELLASIVHDTQTDTPLSITTYQNEAKEPSKAELHYHKDLTDEELLFLKKKNKRRTYYYHRDHQGSITHLTDEEGKVVESFTYDAYGTILEHTQTHGTLNPYGYTGREFDVSVANETNIVPDLYYYRARYYDPMQGRFISQDPIEFLAGDVNFYRYVGGDPVNWVDPSGLIKGLGGSNGTSDSIGSTIDKVAGAKKTESEFEKCMEKANKGYDKYDASVSEEGLKRWMKAETARGRCRDKIAYDRTVGNALGWVPKQYLESKPKPKPKPKDCSKLQEKQSQGSGFIVAKDKNGTIIESIYFYDGEFHSGPKDSVK